MLKWNKRFLSLGMAVFVTISSVDITAFAAEMNEVGIVQEIEPSTNDGEGNEYGEKMKPDMLQGKSENSVVNDPELLQKNEIEQELEGDLEVYKDTPEAVIVVEKENGQDSKDVPQSTIQEEEEKNGVDYTEVFQESENGDIVEAVKVGISREFDGSNESVSSTTADIDNESDKGLQVPEQDVIQEESIGIGYSDTNETMEMSILTAVDAGTNNNTIDTATFISLNSWFTDNLTSASDVNWYKFTVPKAGYISLDFEHDDVVPGILIGSEKGTCWKAYLCDSNEDKLAWYTFDGDKNSYTKGNIGVPEGTYYLKIYKANYYASENYSIKIHYTGSNVWETEFNDNYIDADEINIDSSYYGSLGKSEDVDWYKFTVSNVANMWLEFGHKYIGSKEYYWKLYLYDSGLSQIALYASKGNTTLFRENINLSNGIYYIKIVKNYYSDNGYSLKISPFKSIEMTETSIISDQTYTGQEIKPKVAVKDGDKELVQGTDYTLVYSNNINVGIATVVIKGIGGYTGTITKNFNIIASTNKYTIAFNGNGSTNGMMDSLSSLDYGNSYTLPANVFKKMGYQFTGWNTKSDGTGKTYDDKASVKNLTSENNGTVVLYAQWEKVKYTITYNLGGGVNNDSNPTEYYVTTSTITLKNPSRTGYTFAGWYKESTYKTKVTSIAKGSTGNKTFYAKWTPNQYTIAFSGNGATSGKMTSLASRKYGSSYTLSANTFKRTGYQFVGWNTKADGSGKAYADKASVKNLTSKNNGTVTLYAQWTKVKYKITYNLGGGTNDKSNPSGYYITTSTITLKAPSRTGYTFAGWYKESTYKTKVTSIAKGSTGNKTFYAKWTPNQYTIAFSGNGATSGKMTSLASRKYGSSYTLSANTFKRTGYQFVGWNTKADGSGKAYADKASVKNLTSKNNGTIVLYAQWKHM